MEASTNLTEPLISHFLPSLSHIATSTAPTDSFYTSVPALPVSSMNAPHADAVDASVHTPNLDHQLLAHTVHQVPGVHQQPAVVFQEYRESVQHKHEKSTSCRYDSSLGLLTKKFLTLIQHAPGGILDLNAAAISLEVQKRRIYDITNVLEGIGLIEKKSKNNIVWKGAGLGATEKDVHVDLEKMRAEVSMLRKRELELDKNLGNVSTMLHQQDQEYGHLHYIQHTKLRELAQFARKTVIAVRGPYGATLEVPDPDDRNPDGSRRYQVFIKSNAKPIDVFLVSKLPGDSEMIEKRKRRKYTPPEASPAAQPTGEPSSSAVSVANEVQEPRPSHRQDYQVALIELSPLQSDPDFHYSLNDSEGVSDFFFAPDTLEAKEASK